MFHNPCLFCHADKDNFWINVDIFFHSVIYFAKSFNNNYSKKYSKIESLDQTGQSLDSSYIYNNFVISQLKVQYIKHFITQCWISIKINHCIATYVTM